MTSPASDAIAKLSPAQQLAGLLRILARHDYDDKLAGHVSLASADGESFWVNPLGVFWRRVRAEDILRVDVEGRVVEGQGPVNPTILFHTELHRARPDIGVAIHNHPPYGTIWAAAGKLPPLLDQTGANGGGKAILYAEYPGAVLSKEVAAEQAAAYGDADMAILANHGTLVSGDDVAVALVRALSFEWRCRKAWEVAAMGTAGLPLAPEIATGLALHAATYGQMLFCEYLIEELERDGDFLGAGTQLGLG